MRIRSLAVLVAVVVALGWAAPAFAVTYGTLASPIKAEDSSAEGNAWFYGAVVVKDQTWLRNRYYFRDSAPGGNAAYGATDWYFWKTCGDNTACFVQSGSDRSHNDSSGNWQLEFDYQELDGSSSTGRARTRVCEDQNNQPDDCSRNVYVTLAY